MRKREAAPLLAVVVFTFAATTSFGAAITGKVTDAQLGTPLPSMVVAAYSDQGLLQASATSDSTGRYSLTLANGTYRLLAYDNAGVFATAFYGDAPSFESTQATSVSADLSNINFALKRAGFISGAVMSASGSPSGVTVAAYNPDGSRRGFTLTNSTGGYSLVLPPGDYKLAAYDNGGVFWPSFWLDQTSFASATAITVSSGVTSSANFRLDAAANVTGSVVDDDDGLVLAGMTVAAYDSRGVKAAEATTGANGSYAMRLPPGSYRMAAFDLHNEYATAFFGAPDFANATEIALSPGQTRNDVRIGMWRGANVPGTITDTSGQPLPLTVAAYGADGTLRQTVQTGPNGSFAFLLAPGDYRLAAYDDNLVYATQFFSQKKTFASATPFEVASGQNTASILFAMSRGARIAGTITDAADNRFVQDVTVAAYDDTGLVASARTDASGAYAFVVPIGTYRIAAFDSLLRYATSFSGGSSFETSSTLSASTSDTINFAVARGARVTGTIQDRFGNPLSGIAVSALDGDGHHMGTAISKNGVFELALLPGSYRFSAVDPLSRFAVAATSSALNVTPNGVSEPIVLVLLSQTRRHAVAH